MSWKNTGPCVGVLAILILGPLGGVLPGADARAAPPQSPGKAATLEDLATKKQGLPKTFHPPKPPPPDEPPPADGGLRAYMASTDQAIQFYQARVKANPQDFIGYCYLGEMYRRKAIEKGILDDYAQAEAALRKALELFPHFPRAESALATVLCSRHKFAEALQIARKQTKENPRNLDALATLGDALLETGQYAEAEKALQKLHRVVPAMPEVLARQAGLAELKGDTETAMRLMQQAVKAVQKESTDPKAVAWYLARLGDITFAVGRIEEAEAFYRSVAEGTDPYHDATAALGRLRAGQGRLEEAVALYQKAVAIGPDPHMLAALGDLHQRLGREAEARPLFERVVAIASGRNEYLRVLSLFYSDHDRDLPRALELARTDLVDRKDVYGYDTLAWALLKNNRPEEAAQAMSEALKLGTKDALLDYHAGLIQLRLGDKARAREYLSRALSRNPVFSIHAGDARKVLESLEKPVDPVQKP